MPTKANWKQGLATVVSAMGGELDMDAVEAQTDRHLAMSEEERAAEQLAREQLEAFMRTTEGQYKHKLSNQKDKLGAMLWQLKHNEQLTDAERKSLAQGLMHSAGEAATKFAERSPGLKIRRTSNPVTSYFYFRPILGCIDADLCKYISKYSFFSIFKVYNMCILLHRSNLSNLGRFCQKC